MTATDRIVDAILWNWFDRVSLWLMTDAEWEASWDPITENQIRERFYRGDL